MTRATQKEQVTTTHDFEKKLIDIFRTFYQRKLRRSFQDWEPKCGDNIHHTALSSATGLESPKSLASDICAQLRVKESFKLLFAI